MSNNIQLPGGAPVKMIDGAPPVGERTFLVDHRHREVLIQVFSEHEAKMVNSGMYYQWLPPHQVPVFRDGGYKPIPVQLVGVRDDKSDTMTIQIVQ